MKNRTIGIIGGVGPQATSYLYQRIIELSQSKYKAKDNDDYPHLIIESLPIPDFISDEKQIPKAKKMLRDAVQRFTTSSVDRICIASNTVNILLEELQESTEVEFIPMIELVSDKCKSYSYTTVALLGTPVLTDSGIYSTALKKRSIDLITPKKYQLLVVERIIRSVLSGKISTVDKSAYIQIINELFDKGAEAIILGCTELPLAIDYTVLGKRIINSDEVLAEGIVDFYYEDK